MKTTFLFTLLLTGAMLTGARGQNVPDRAATRSGTPVLDVGIRLQKAVGLYTENGLTAQYAGAARRVYYGISYVTSRLGTALNSNAIKQDNLLASVSYFFRPKWLIQPVIRANVGYFKADYGSALFSELPQTSLLASPELGVCYCPNRPLNITGSAGYNLLTGNGLTAPGTLYPVFVQTSVTWNILKKPTN